MSRAAAYPICFPSIEVYAGWHLTAMRCKEACTPCDDCTPKYRAEAVAQYRCNPDRVREAFVIHPSRARPPPTEIETDLHFSETPTALKE